MSGYRITILEVEIVLSLHFASRLYYHCLQLFLVFLSITWKSTSMKGYKYAHNILTSPICGEEEKRKTGRNLHKSCGLAPKNSPRKVFFHPN